MVNDKAFIFHVYIPWGKTLFRIPKSRSTVKVKVKYQGPRFRKKKKKNGGCGGIRFSQTQLVYFRFMVSKWGTICLSEVIMVFDSEISYQGYEK